MASTTTYDARLPSVTTTTANVSHNLPMLSYNSTGWNTFKADFINTILLFTISIFAFMVYSYFIFNCKICLYIATLSCHIEWIESLKVNGEQCLPINSYDWHYYKSLLLFCIYMVYFHYV